MVEETVGGFDEVQEEAMGVFTLIVVEPRHRGWVEELMEKFAALSPLTSVFHHGNIPGGMAHP
jgi:hypothetical protein